MAETTQEDVKNFAEASGSFIKGVSLFLGPYLAANPGDAGAKALKDEAEFMIEEADLHGFYA